MLTRKYFLKCYSCNIDKLEELDKFLERQIPNLTQEEMNTLNSVVCTKEIVFVVVLVVTLAPKNGST